MKAKAKQESMRWDVRKWARIRCWWSVVGAVVTSVRCPVSQHCHMTHAQWWADDLMIILLTQTRPVIWTVWANMVFVVDRMVMEVVETSDHNDEETEEDDIVITNTVSSCSALWWCRSVWCGHSSVIASPTHQSLTLKHWKRKSYFCLDKGSFIIINSRWKLLTWILCVWVLIRTWSLNSDACVTGWCCHLRY